MKKKLILAAATLAMAVGVLGGCGNDKDSASSGGSDGGKREELRFWGWWSSEARKPHIDQIVKDFNESQDKYTVKYEDIPFGDIFTKNIAQIAAGKPADIIANSMEETKFRASQDQTEPMDDFVSADEKNAFYEQYVDACTADDGTLRALPLSVDTRAIYYNKDHFKEAGIDPESIKTWEDLIEASNKLDKKSGDNYERVGFMPLLGNANIESWFANANGGNPFFDKDMNPAVDTADNLEVMKRVRAQIDHYGQSKYDELKAAFDSGMADPFVSGVLSTLTQSSSYTAVLKQQAPDMDYGVIQFPEFKEGTGNMVNGGGFVLEIPKGAKNPEGSAEFIKFVTSKETQEFLSDKLGDFSARQDFPEDADFFKNPINQELAGFLEDTELLITPNKYKGYMDVLTPVMDEGVLGQKSPEDTLKQGQKALEDFQANAQ